MNSLTEEKMEHTAILSKELSLNPAHVKNIITLIDEGSTIPFIARYRKELTGSCDDQVLRQLADRLAYLRNLEKRKEEVISAIAALEKLTDELKEQILSAQTLAEVEDLYRPYKTKRRTRATIARERGLEPLAAILMMQDVNVGNIMEIAAGYIDAEKGVADADAAIAGALDIVAEDISDNAEIRKELREYARKNAVLTSKAAKQEDSVYRMYYEYTEPVAKMPGHRILAVNRGEKEDFLKVSLEINEKSATNIIDYHTILHESPCAEYLERAVDDSWQRLIYPSLEREIRSEMTETASDQAINMFGVNLRPLLMQPPVKGNAVLGLDPAYRTGCKLAVVNATGKVLDTEVIYPTPPNNKVSEGRAAVKRLVAKHGVDLIAIGNGTASKESEIFVADTIKEIPQKVSYMVVNEAGASVYSASKLGALEFPDFDVSLRSAVSIARRLQDPLAELVKIDPKAIGVGQYQHDMPAAKLDQTLTGVVEDCVNTVGVDVNTASPSLLSYVSGITAATSKNICVYREENGAFTSRTDFKKVPKLGPKAYEQCAGFLRIPGGKRILDNTAVHPESYDAAKKLLELFGYTEKDISAGNLTALNEQIKNHSWEKTAEFCGVGVPTLRDIAAELQKPGRDIRDSLPPPILRTDVFGIEDLVQGMDFTGTVRNVTDFGAFVDIGVHQDGLVHVSQMSEKFIKHPSQAVKVGDIVKVWVISADVEKKKIALTMRPL